MLSTIPLATVAGERLAVKDDHLVYRGCTRSFAQLFGVGSPDEVVGSTDFALLPRAEAREQLVHDSRVMRGGQPDIGLIELGPSRRRVLIVRLPVCSPDQRVRGIDIRLVDNVDDPAQLDTLLALVECGATVQESVRQAASRKPASKHAESRPVAAASRQHSDATCEADHGAAHPATRAMGHDRSHRAAPGAVHGTAQPLSGGLLGGLFKADVLDMPFVPATNNAPKEPATVGGFAPVADSSSSMPKPADAVLQLRLQGLRFRHFAESSADFFWELDADMKFSYVSPTFATVFDLPRSVVLGHSHTELLSNPKRIDSDCFWQEHLQLLSNRQAFRDFEFRWDSADGTRFIRYSGKPIFNRAGSFLGYRGTGSDVTTLVSQAPTTAYYATHDALTTLHNRRHLEQLVSDALIESRESEITHAVCFIDMDNFKVVNDTGGHQAGDELLRQLAQLFISLMHKNDALSRIGGDEFGMLLRDSSMAEALTFANEVRAAVENFQFLWQENRFKVGVSIGLAVLDGRFDDTDAVFRAADSACYRAKHEGRNRVLVHREADGDHGAHRVATQWVEEIGAALNADRLVLACQRIEPLQEDQPGRRLEMLLRMQLPNGELVCPGTFLPAAGRYGLSAALDERAVDLTLRWLDANPKMREDVISCSINLASGSFADGDFALRLVNRIDQSGIDPGKLTFDLTETATIANLTSAASFMHVLSALGCKFCIDSFGSGLSSFSYLRKLPVDCLKIDGLLIKAILTDETQRTLVRAICEISQSMGKRTVATHVDSAELLVAVRSLGIDFAQGFHIAEPKLLSTIP